LSLTLAVLSTFAAAPLAFVLAQRHAALAVSLVPAALFVLFAGSLPVIATGGVVEEAHAWIASLDVALAFRADGLSLLFALLITGIGALIFVYAASYLAHDRAQGRFFAILTLFMGAMLGAVLADDLLLLIVFWELTSLTSFLLIGHDPDSPGTRRAAQQGLLITVAGGLALLAAAVLIGSAAGTYRISGIIEQAATLREHPSAHAAIALLAAGAFAKSAQVPLHAWLPNAMVAPTPVSAYLHSATMVKLGVYLLARFDPVYGAVPMWNALLIGAGLATMLTGTVLALRHTDLKRVLAYSTIVSLGTLVALIGMPHDVAAVAMVTFLVVHALYKACLFLIAGIVDHVTGTRDATRLGGLVRAMPATAAIALLAALSMAGLPPFVGFVGKELVYEAGLSGPLPSLTVGIAVLANACMVVVAGVVTVRVFLGPPGSYALSQHAPPRDPAVSMLIGPLMLAILGLLFGLAPGVAARLLGPAATAVAGHAIEPALGSWHGLTPMLALSIATLVLGVLVFRRWGPLRGWLSNRSAIDRFGVDTTYDRALRALNRLAVWQTRAVQRGTLRSYLSATFTVAAVAILATFVTQSASAWPTFDTADLGGEFALPALLVLASLAVPAARTFTAGITAAGMVGFAVVLVYLFRGAPDLAFTQFAVEALAIVILLAIVGRMPFDDAIRRTAAGRARDIAIATAFGVAAALVLLAVVAAPFDDRLSEYFRAASVPEANGRNLVNVIIVDFRALDTLGEITVLALAALAAAALIASVPVKPRDAAPVDTPRGSK
jgi:multicomponent Na+:H+ antiporter subunit A